MEHQFDEVVDINLKINSNREDNVIEIGRIIVPNRVIGLTPFIDFRFKIRYSGNDVMKVVVEPDVTRYSVMSIMKEFGFSSQAVEELVYHVLTSDFIRFNISGLQFLKEVDPYYRWAVNGNNKG